MRSEPYFENLAKSDFRHPILNISLKGASEPYFENLAKRNFRNPIVQLSQTRAFGTLF